MEVETTNENVLYEPEFVKLDKDEIALDNNKINNDKSINASSMITYSKIVCYMCGVVMDANREGICETCQETLSGSVADRLICGNINGGWRFENDEKTGSPCGDPLCNTGDYRRVYTCE